MCEKLRLEVNGYKEIMVEITSASVGLDDGNMQCWCVQLKVYWQTMRIDGWAFLSSWWGELLFQRIYDGQPPHFISGKPIETDLDNDMLWQFGEDIGVHPKSIADKIHQTLRKVMFIMPPVRLVSDGVIVDSAMAYRYENGIHRIKIGG